MTNSLALDPIDLKAPYQWDKNFVFPYRVWAGMDYDLLKRLKFMIEVFADNGHKFTSFNQAWNSYFDFGEGGTPFTAESQSGDYQPLDLDFGFLWMVSQTFRVGVHFQSPYLTFYWKW